VTQHRSTVSDRVTLHQDSRRPALLVGLPIIYGDDVPALDEPESPLGFSEGPAGPSILRWMDGSQHGGGCGGATGDDTIHKIVQQQQQGRRIYFSRFLVSFVLSNPATAPAGAPFSVGGSPECCFGCGGSAKVGAPEAVGPVLDSGAAAEEPAGRGLLSGRDAARQRPVRANTKNSSQEGEEILGRVDG
jgi:hypothetical protein